jgi:pimeloyl-ACP methyl ester carboxylesterase
MRWWWASGGVTAVLVFALLRWLGYRKDRKHLLKYNYRATSFPDVPDELFVVINGFLGTTSSGSNICDAICKVARARNRSVVALRVQASEALFGVNVYTSGVKGASENTLHYVREQLQLHPSIVRVSFVGNSFGAIVARHVARELWQSKQVRLGSFVTFPSPFLGLTEATFSKLSLLRQFAIRFLPWYVFDELRLLDSHGRNGKPILVDLSTDCDYLNAFELS